LRARFIADAWPWQRQLPEGSHHWRDVEFVFDDSDHYDAAVVFGLPSRELDLGVPAERTYFVASEPPTVHRYDDRFLRQFGTVITCDAQTRHPRKFVHQVGLPWHLGVWADTGQFRANAYTFEQLARLDPPKTKLVSVVTSDKAFTKQHRTRLAFVDTLTQRLGDVVDVFGRGIATFVDKAEIVEPYRFHVAIENCSVPHYWSEKLADPILALSYPIYHGAPNVGGYFPSGSLTSIDIRHPDRAIAIISQALESEADRAGEEALRVARDAVLRRHNLFAVLACRLRADGAHRPYSPGRSRIRTEASVRSPFAAARTRALLLPRQAAEKTSGGRRLRNLRSRL
jgi:hypothetical protein